MIKFFFIDKVPNDFALLDFGCADGTLIYFLNSLFNNNFYIGYDFDKLMISEAEKKLSFLKLKDNILFSENYNFALNKIKTQDKSKIINLSSIIHEVYSYSSYNDIELFWNKVFDGTFDYVVIRDMIPSNSVNRDSYPR